MLTSVFQGRTFPIEVFISVSPVVVVKTWVYGDGFIDVVVINDCYALIGGRSTPDIPGYFVVNECVRGGFFFLLLA